MYVFITAVHITKMFAWEEGEGWRVSFGNRTQNSSGLCGIINAGPIMKLCAGGGGGQ